MMKNFYGVVEGFFSRPLPVWTVQERSRIIELISREAKMNTYLYCPKDDAFVTAKWAELYPENNLQALSKNIGECRAAGIEFVYGLNPDFDINAIKMDFSIYCNAIARKLRQLQSIGVKTFCLLFDDIPFAYNVLAEQTDNLENQVAENQIRTVNAVYDLLKLHSSQLWYCASDYFFTRENQFAHQIRENLNPAIPIIWTGPQVFTATITSAMVEKIQRLVGPKRQIIWWDNYPVNDCEHLVSAFHIGAFNPPELSAGRELGGILVNPMRQAMANCPFLITFDQYLNNPPQYSQNSALALAFQQLFGQAGKSLLRIYQSFSAKNIVQQQPRAYLSAIIEINKISEYKIQIKRLAGDLEAAAKIKTGNEFAAGFLTQTSAVVERAKLFITLSQKIFTRQKFFHELTQFDPFPVVKDKKYLTKIFKVLVERSAYTAAAARTPSSVIQQLLAMVKTAAISKLNNLTPDNDYERALIRLAEFYVKYFQTNRLMITAQHEKVIVNTVDEIIRLEQQYFYQALANHPRLAQIQHIIKRSLINGY